MTSRMQQRRDTAANWTANNPTLAGGELGFETDTGLFKIGNGSTNWVSLGYAGGGASYAAIATSGGTTTLTSTSNTTQNFTGTNTQTVVLPVTSTLQLGWAYQILNNSTQNVTINSSGGNTIAVLQPGFSGLFTCQLTSGTTAASWDYQFSGFDFITGTGNIVAVSGTGTVGQVLTSTGTGTQWASAGGGDPTPTVFMLMGA